MRHEVIRQMMADPGFNPETWMEKAIIEFISKNAEELAGDKVAVPYLIRGMEGEELVNMAEHVAKTGDVELIQTLSKTMNEVSEREHKRTIGRALKKIIECTPPEKQDLVIGFLPEIKNASLDPKGLIHRFTPGQMATAVKNWWPSWNFEIWEKIINRMAEIDVFPVIRDSKFLETISLEAEDRNSMLGWPTEAQKIVVKIISKVHDDHIPDFMGWATNIHFKGLYSDKDYTKLAKKCKDLSDIKVDDKMCRCGFVASSGSGITLHLQRAEKDTTRFNKCTQLQVTVALALKIARSPRFGYLARRICRKCGDNDSARHDIGCYKVREIA